MRVETARVIGGLDFNRAKHGMSYQRRKTVVRVLQCDLQDVFVQRARAELMWSCDCGSSAFDVGEQLGMWREWSDFERPFPRAYEILRSDFLAVGPTCIVAQVKCPDA